jgi:hypothetical protein
MSWCVANSFSGGLVCRSRSPRGIDRFVGGFVRIQDLSDRKEIHE